MRVLAFKIDFKLKQVFILTDSFIENIVYIMVIRVNGDDGDNDDEDIRDEHEGGHGKGLCDEGDDNNGRGVCDEGDDSHMRGTQDQDGVPSNHGFTISPHNFDQRVKWNGFDTEINQITKKESFVCMKQQSTLKFSFKKKQCMSLFD